MLHGRNLMAGLLAAMCTGVFAASSAYAVNVRDDQAGNNVDTANAFSFVGNLGGCTASLIDRRTILLAGHCVTSNGDADGDGVLDGPGNPPNVIGTGSSITFQPNSAGPFFSGSSTVTFPGYIRSSATPDDSFFLNDIAIITLDDPVLGITPVPLASANPAAGTSITIVGYGAFGTGTAPGNPGDGQRRFITNLIDSIVASGAGHRILFDFDNPAGDPTATAFEGMQDGGDSGGPMLISDGLGGWIQIGIASGASSPRGYGSNGSFTAVASYLNFIQQNAGLLNAFAQAGSGNWTDPTLWENRTVLGNLLIAGTVPDNYDLGASGYLTSNTAGGPRARYYDVFIEVAGTKTIQSGDDIEIDSLFIDHAAAQVNIDNGGSLDVVLDAIIADGILNVDGQFSAQMSLLQAGGLLTVGAAGGVSVADGALVLNSIWTIGGDLDTDTLTMFASTLDVTNGGDVDVTNTAFLQDTPLTVFSGGSFAAGSLTQVRGDITVHNGGIVDIAAALTSSDNTVDVGGTLEAGSLSHTVGVFNVLNGGAVSVFGAAVMDSSPLTVFSGGGFSALSLTQINGALTVHGGGTADVTDALTATGNIVTVDGALTAGSLNHTLGVFNVGGTGTADVTGAAVFTSTPVGIAAGGGLDAGTLTFDGGNLSVGLGGHASADGSVTSSNNSIGLAGLLSGASLTHTDGILVIAPGGAADFSGIATLDTVATGLAAGGSFSADKLNVIGGSFIHEGLITATLVELTGAALFTGTGTVDGALTNTDGHVVPGLSIGTIVIAGDYVQGPAGVLSIETTGLEIDLLDVGGSADLAGTLNVSQLGLRPARAGDMLAFIEADGGVTGTFDTLNLPALPGLLFFDVAYNAFDVMLITDVESYVPWAPEEPAVTIAHVVDQFDRKTIDPDLREVLDFLDVNPVFINESLTTWNPTDIHVFPKAMAQLTGLLGDQFSRRITRVLTGSAAPVEVAFAGLGGTMSDAAEAQIMAAAAAARAGVDDEHPWTPGRNLPNNMGVFLAGDVAVGNGETVVGPDSDFNAFAITAGFDSRVGRYAMLGAAVSYTSANSDLSGSGEYEGEGVMGSIYGALWHGGFHLDGFGSFGDLNITTARPVIAGLDRYVSEGEVDGSQIHAGANAGYVFGPAEGFKFGPVLRYRYTRLSIDGYSETGGPVDLKFDPNTPKASTLGAGVQLGHDFRWGDARNALTAYLRVTSEWELADTSHIAVASFVGAPGIPFDIVGVPWDDQYYSLHFGINGQLNEHVAFHVGYETDFGRDDLDSHRLSGTLRWGF